MRVLPKRSTLGQCFLTLRLLTIPFYVAASSGSFLNTVSEDVWAFLSRLPDWSPIPSSGGKLPFQQFTQVNGVPQGGVLSVALFAVVINDIADELPSAVGRSLFVDDLALWCSASSVRHVTRQLQLAVARLEKWTSENGLRFSAAKTTSVHFCRRRCTDTQLGIRLGGQLIPTEPVARFLGVWFDSRLTYKEHFKTLREKCFKSLNVLKCVSRTSYGADRRTLFTSLSLHRPL